MQSCKFCGSPEKNAVGWSCGTIWANGKYEISGLCRIRKLTHEVSELKKTLGLYEDAMCDMVSEKKLIGQLRDWYEAGGEDPYDLRAIIWNYFKEKEDV